MPIALALLASAVLHVAAILGPAWDLPGLDDAAPADTPPHMTRLDAVLKPAEPDFKVINKAQAVPEGKPQTQAQPAPRKAKKPRSAPATRQIAASPAHPAESPLDQTRSQKVPTFSDAREKTAEPGVEEPMQENSQEIVDKTAPEIATPAANPFPLPAEGRMRFDVTRGERGFIVGQSINTWSHDGTHYRLQNVSETTGLAALFKSAQVVQASQGEITPQGLRPLSFSNERKGKKETVSFDWATHQITFDGQTAVLPDGAQDMLSLYYQLAWLVASGQPMNSIDLTIASGRKLDNYHFDLIGEESIQAMGQKNPSLHLRTNTGKDIIDLWIAKTRIGLPLKIRFTDRKGEIFEQILNEISTTDAPPTDATSPGSVP